MVLSSILCVCLGNICRSPLAEGVLEELIKKQGLDIKVESAGTAGYHVGSEPDERSIEVCKLHGITLTSRCRQLCSSDFNDFDIILGMDNSNIANIEKVRPKGSKAKVVLFGEYGGSKAEIKDPYYDNSSKGFERCYQQCVTYGEALLKAEL